MITKFWEGLGDKLADKWVASVLAPAFAFWAGGLLAWIYRFGWVQLEKQFNQLSSIAQGALLIGGLLGIAASSVIVQRLDLPVLRLLEGYWPGWLNRLRTWAIHLQSTRRDQAAERWQQLAAKKHLGKLNPQEQEEYVRLDLQLMRSPPQSDQRMPTRLGNILRAAENRPLDKYGLNTIICWPRLWLLLPDGTKNELSEARTSLDTAVRTLLWGVLFLIWTIWAWWAIPVGLVVAVWAYRWTLSAAEVYGDLLVSAFDLHRTLLYETLRWPLPKQTAVEKTQGEQLSQYLFRGTLPRPIWFQNSEKKKDK